MTVIPTAIPDVLIIEPTVHGDERGFFFESFNQRTWEQKTGLKTHFVQDNHSRSVRGVLRGLHYQMVQPHLPAGPIALHRILFQMVGLM